MLKGRNTGSFVLRVFICFLKVRILGKVLMRIFISFPSVSFDLLMHQNDLIEGIILWPVSSSKNVTGKAQNPSRSAPGMVWNMWKPFVPKCPWLGKIRYYELSAGCKLLGLVIYLSQFLHSTYP